MSAWQFGVLGPVSVSDGHGPVEVRGARRRALLVRLLAARGAPVPVDVLIDELWDGQPPPGATSTLQSHVSLLRRALRDRLVSSAAGYRVVILDGELDADAFEADAREGRRALDDLDPARACTLLDRALSRWRGAALADVVGSTWAVGEAARLTELRLATMEARFDAALAIGDHHDLPGRIEAVVAEHPLRERLWAQLMLALYRSGRQSEALRAFQRLRTMLGEELGVEPSAELVGLDQAILSHRPDLDWRPPTPHEVSLGGSSPRTTEPVVGSAAPRRTAGARLPPVQPLVDRDDLIARVADVLHTSRLVTLTGPGGVGKTSVAAHVVGRGEEASVGGDGVVFVDLTAIEDGSLLRAAIGSALGLQSNPDEDADAAIVHAIGDRALLFLLDNCEHVLDAAAELVERVLAETDASFLTTSQEPLNVAGELRIQVEPLSLPAAVELFVTIADRRCGIELAGDDESVARICESVDRLPLAVELVASRTQSMTPSEIARDLTGESLLALRRRGGSARLRTLESTISWSYGLLEPHAQQLLRHISVFAGEFDLAALRAVADVPGPTVADVVDVLVARSLVVATHTPDGVRYRLLSVIRAFAWRQLQSAGDAAGVIDRFTDHMIAWAAAMGPLLDGAEPAPAVQAVQRQAANIRAAYHHLIDRGDDDGAARLFTGFGRTGLGATGAIAELEEWARRAIHAPGLHDRTRLWALLVATWVAHFPPTELASVAEQAWELATELDDRTAQFLALSAVGEGWADVDQQRAEQWCEVGRTLDATDVAPVNVAPLYVVYVNLLLRSHRLDAAEALLDELLAGDTRRYGYREADLLYKLGRLHLLRDRLDDADRAFAQCSDVAQRNGSPLELSSALAGQVQLAQRRGDHGRALELSHQGLDIALRFEPREQKYDRFNIVVAAAHLGQVDLVHEQLAALRALPADETGMFREAATGYAEWASGSSRAAVGHFTAAIPLTLAIGSAVHLEMVLDGLRLCLDGVRAREMAAITAALHGGHLDVPTAAARALAVARDTP